jgi:hypothetical protein
MTITAKAVHRGVDGSVHFLSSSPDRSFLLITDPAFGVRRIPVEGLCRLISGHPSGAARYEAISPKWSTTIDVSPGQEPRIREMGWCDYCLVHTEGHDFELWPSCPSGDRHRRRKADADSDNVVPVPEPEQESVVSSGTGTGGEPASSSKGRPRVRVLDAESAPVQEEPLSRGEAASRWGPTPGAYW